MTRNASWCLYNSKLFITPERSSFFAHGNPLPAALIDDFKCDACKAPGSGSRLRSVGYTNRAAQLTEWDKNDVNSLPFVPRLKI